MYLYSMIENIVNFAEIEAEGTFLYEKKVFFCCKKIIDLYFILSKDYLYFFKGKNKTELFLEIKRDLILAINKYQFNIKDRHKFSIFYLDNNNHKNNNKNQIYELRLQTKFSIQTNNWVQILNANIKPKIYEFNYSNKNYIQSDQLFDFKDQRQFYIALCNLEYILLVPKMKDFFDYYHKSIGDRNIIENRIGTKGQNKNNNNISFLEEFSRNESEKIMIDVKENSDRNSYSNINERKMKISQKDIKKKNLNNKSVIFCSFIKNKKNINK